MSILCGESVRHKMEITIKTLIFKKIACCKHASWSGRTSGTQNKTTCSNWTVSCYRKGRLNKMTVKDTLISEHYSNSCKKNTAVSVLCLFEVYLVSPPSPFFRLADGRREIWYLLTSPNYFSSSFKLLFLNMRKILLLNRNCTK